MLGQKSFPFKCTQLLSSKICTRIIILSCCLLLEHILCPTMTTNKERKSFSISYLKVIAGFAGTYIFHSSYLPATQPAPVAHANASFSSDTRVLHWRQIVQLPEFSILSQIS